MLNEEKIILMTKLAIYEKGEGKKEIPMSRYYRNDYVGVHMLYTFLSVTAGYVLLFALYIARDVEGFLSSLTTMDLKKFLFTALAIYVGAELFFLLVTWILYRHRFKKNRQHLNEYYGNLKKLRKIQKKEQAAAIKMVEGKEDAPKEEPEDEDSLSENAVENDIFREPEQQGYFRRRKGKRAGEAVDSQDTWDADEDIEFLDGEEADFYDGEEAEEAGDFYDGEEAEEAGDFYDGEEAEEATDFYNGEEAVDLSAREDMDGNFAFRGGENKNKDGDDTAGSQAGEHSDGAVRFSAGGDTDSDTHRRDRQELTSGKTAKESETTLPQKNSQEPELTLEQELRKMILENSEDDEEDEDGFTFSS